MAVIDELLGTWSMPFDAQLCDTHTQVSCTKPLCWGNISALSVICGIPMVTLQACYVQTDITTCFFNSEESGLELAHPPGIYTFILHL